MKIILGSRRPDYLARGGIFLLAVALIIGMVGCGGSCLTVTITSTAGGSVTTPGEGTFSYCALSCCPGTDLEAEADEGYRFIEWTGVEGGPDDPDAAVTHIVIGRDCSITTHFGPECIPMVAAGSFHTVGLKDNGRVYAVGDNSHGQCAIGSWRGINQTAAGSSHTVGLRSDGTVIAIGENSDTQCDVGGWTNINQVAAGSYHTVGLKSDGTVVAVGLNDDGQCDVGSWTGIVQIAAGGWHTAGLKGDSSVVAVGLNDDGQCEVGGWHLT